MLPFRRRLAYSALLCNGRRFCSTLMEHEETLAKTPRILMTGGLGQLGRELSKGLRQRYGHENVIVTDIAKPNKTDLRHVSPYMFLDIMDLDSVYRIVANENIDWILHFSALLSAKAEQSVRQAIDLNVHGLNNVLDVAKQYGLRVFVPSTIGAFGPEIPRHMCPDRTVQRPKTIYGVTKVYCELIGEV